MSLFCLRILILSFLKSASDIEWSSLSKTLLLLHFPLFLKYNRPAVVYVHEGWWLVDVKGWCLPIGTMDQIWNLSWNRPNCDLHFRSFGSCFILDWMSTVQVLSASNISSGVSLTPLVLQEPHEHENILKELVDCAKTLEIWQMVGGWVVSKLCKVSRVVIFNLAMHSSSILSDSGDMLIEVFSHADPFFHIWSLVGSSSGRNVSWILFAITVMPKLNWNQPSDFIHLVFDKRFPISPSTPDP